MSGVYVGNFASDYEILAFKESKRIEGMAVLGVRRTTVSNRVRYMHNLHGPSVTLDTACSSTLYAIHFTVQTLRNGEILPAFVGGVNLILTLEYHFAIGKISALCPTAQCHAFDAFADGYSRGEAIDILYLKRVSDAIRDGDPIRGVIRGSSLTANGKNNSITLSSAMAQELSTRNAYEHSSPFIYGYVECHGTGTPAGDPIQTIAIGNVFGRHGPLYIESTKPYDYVIAMGNFESVKTSNESTGIVSRVGDNVTHLHPGDKVICLERGYYDTFLRSSVKKCLKFDDDTDLAHLEANEAVLIQAATGGLGLAVIQYVKYVGAEIYATVGTQQKKDYLKCECGISKDHIFESRMVRFKDDLLKQTHGRGVDAVLSIISGPGLHESLNCLAPCGRLIDVGRGSILDKGSMGLHALEKSVSFISFDLNSVLEEKPRIAARLELDCYQTR
ncbi:hypothetical protein N8T08_008133 [Aspergillus melleus]|uniref:Uncharacterized protein n=1 Tax=Aspergillus melleus TaxID=138277 RepID=A0ACC3AWX4_9EURO|nr:hypothetical protein N8T08_008133 [Aspergillus melleus]